MAVIGTFVPTKEGGWVGNIRTLLIDVRVRFVPNDNKSSEAAPAFRVYAGESEIGAAWHKVAAGEQGREYFSVQLDDPLFPESIQTALFAGQDSKSATLVWRRRI